MLKGSAYVLALMIFGEGVGLLLVIVAGNYYSVEATGLLLALQNNLFLFGTIGTLGLGSCFHRFVPQVLAESRFDRVRGLLRWVFGLATIGLLVTTSLHVWFLMATSTISLGLPIILFASLAVLAWGGVTLGRNFLRSMQLTFWSEFSYQVIRPMGGLIILVVGALMGTSNGVIVAALLLPLLIGIGHDVWRMDPLVEKLNGAFTLDQRPIWRRTAVDFAIFNLSRVILQRLDLLVVTAFSGLEAAAVYGLVSRLAILSNIAVDPIQSMFQPRATHHYAQNDKAGLEKDVITGSLWIFSASLLVGVGFLVLAPVLLPVFGDAVRPGQSWGLLAILLLGNVAIANTSIASALLLMTGGEVGISRLYALLVFLVFPPALFLGTWTAGLWGAAIATVFIRLMLAFGATWLAYKKTGTLVLPKPTMENLRLAFAPLLAKARRGP